MSEPTSFPAALRLVYVADLAAAKETDRLEALAKGGVTAIWLREPSATGHELFEAAGALLLRCRRLSVALLVGDRPDVALAIGADGVQLGHRSVPPRAVRPWYRGWMGVSCHTAADIAAAESAGADHVVVSPVYGVPAKGEPLGLTGLRALIRNAHVPVVALGGIETSNAFLVRSAGAAGVGVIRALRDAANAEHAAQALSAPVTGA